MKGPLAHLSDGDDGALMKGLKTTVARPQTPPLTANNGPLAANVARELLTQPGLGVTRISYVGLPEREAVQLVIDASHDGMQAETTREGARRISVTLAAPGTAQRAAGAAAGVSAAGSWQRAWARLWTSGQRVSRLLGRRTR